MTDEPDIYDAVAEFREAHKDDAYQEFIASRVVAARPSGFTAGPLHASLKDFQQDTVRWACKHGRAAIFAGCGLGKTFEQLAWSDQCYQHTKRDALILCPLAVAAQTRREAEKFGYQAHVIRQQSEVSPGINICNYEMLKAIDPTHFGSVVLDESSILKSFMGKTKMELIDAFAETPYRLCCTATPAPNDHMELGNHSQFLGVMDSNEMISRWFTNDTMAAGSYRLKHHARKDFWRWVSSWAFCISSPGDLGYDGTGYVLPELRTHQHVVSVDVVADAAEGEMFRDGDLSATNLHKEMRLTKDDRARKAASLIGPDDDYWIIWCNTNYEADALSALLPDAVEVRGSEAPAIKEKKLDEFARGKHRILISKPRIAGLGLNLQHVNKVCFVGLSYSFEQFYQAIRRTWRFGQKRPVECHVISAVTEGAISKVIAEKEAEHRVMEVEMLEAMRWSGLGKQVRTLRNDCGDASVRIPGFVRSHG